MTLPGGLVEVLDLVGVDWPAIDEDEIRDSARDYRRLAEGIRDVITEGNRACSHIVGGKSKGRTVQAIDRRWGRLTTKDLSTFSSALDDLAGALDNCAGFIEGCKVACIAELTATAATATAGVIGMFFTAGLSGLLSAAAITACRIALNEAIDYAVGEITAIVTDKIEAKILAQIENLFTDQLDADDDTTTDYATGSGDMAQDLAIEFDEFDKASSDYDETRRNFDKKKGTHQTGSTKRRSSVKKDSRFHKLATVMDKADDAVDKKADETVLVLEKHGGKIDESKKEHKKSDTKVKDDLDQCTTDSDTPMYLLNADGTVERLNPDGTTEPVKKTDNSGIRDLMTEPGQKPGEAGRVWRPRKGEKGPSYPVSPSKDKATVTSQKVDPGTTDLSRATQIARYHNQDWGGGNYAAGRYIGNDGNDIILVTNSEGPHSERTLGYPILKAGKQDNLTEIYTERQPCQGRPSWCDKWTAKYFGEDLEVTHSTKYLNSEEAKTRDTEHEKYRNQLEKDQKTGGVSGGFR
ncbi:nucleic acid/nucleotide deaminase domain-containing protein [Streptomyces sp. NPDC093252]|uniref:nucleic acid/nucleotide deaminase domain-containing protein n=1 Tax=Streptomyces sp. NPDC093252 TaxID=3154980 RepID=UPI003427A5D2